MRIVFCSEPFSPFRVDSAYESEVDAAQEAGFEFDLVDFEALESSKSLFYDGHRAAPRRRMANRRTWRWSSSGFAGECGHRRILSSIGNSFAIVEIRYCAALSLM